MFAKIWILVKECSQTRACEPGTSYEMRFDLPQMNQILTEMHMQIRLPRKEQNDRRGPGASANDVRRPDALHAIGSLRLHWPEYLMEAGELGLYMFLACAFATLLQHPASPVRHFILGDLSRR